ncbi:MAG TPA: SDR family oxidoreductase [Stellaceae bacterium]|nr:SDR family oxidoreductase [Stellaceae bacterium]
MDRRRQIRFTPEEEEAFFREHRKAALATIVSKGWHRRNHPFARCRLCTAKSSRQRDCSVSDDDRAGQKLVAGNAALTRLADSHLLGMIEPNDIASTALYLASDESRMVTGQVLPVDSGVTIS